MTTARSIRFAVVPIAALLALVLGGCSAITDLLAGQNVTRDSDTQEVTEAGDADVFSLQLGDCFNDESASEISEVLAVPCAEAHDNEIYFLFDMPDGEYPGEDAVMAAAEAGCLPTFEAFVGVAYDSSELEWFPLTPTASGWDELGDREIVCAVFDPAALVTGTLAGVAR
ncbi:septum formation family protein [Microbacterium sp. Root180]|uniref:septum formation family protein n=1 Tax=Microbacterium sp. Root180 TaxID=1736483 RepID=UPI0006FA7F96|nr:septum formation family protein [Microbacterium sp. Root180]KRB36964.1 hypothetical protein ASD93_13190 [Microbacterium sp. Root180]